MTALAAVPASAVAWQPAGGFEVAYVTEESDGRRVGLTEAHALSSAHWIEYDSCQPPAHHLPANKPFARWGEVFGDDVVAAMIDRLVHHAEVIALKGNSCRLRNRDLGRVPAAGTTDK